MSKKRFRNDAVEILVFTMLFMIILALIIKAISTRTSSTPIKPIDEIEVTKHNYDEPKDFLEDSSLNENKKAYYERLYDY